MITRGPAAYGDTTCSSYVAVGDLVLLGHHGGGYDSPDVAVQVLAAFRGMAETLALAGATLDDLVQVTLYLRDVADFADARDAFAQALPPGCAPARMTVTTDFVDPAALCQLDGVAARPAARQPTRP